MPAKKKKIKSDQIKKRAASKISRPPKSIPAPEAAARSRKKTGPKPRKAHPDFPIVVDWQSRRVQSLWIPVDRRLVDGRGATVQDLGPYDARVSERLGCGTTKSQLAAQAFALDLCGDEREELVLYQPYHGRSVFIFTQPDSDARPKPYVHQPAAYNIRSYF